MTDSRNEFTPKMINQLWDMAFNNKDVSSRSKSLKALSLLFLLKPTLFKDSPPKNMEVLLDLNMRLKFLTGLDSKLEIGKSDEDFSGLFFTINEIEYDDGWKLISISPAVINTYDLNLLTFEIKIETHADCSYDDKSSFLERLILYTLKELAI